MAEEEASILLSVEGGTTARSRTVVVGNRRLGTSLFDAAVRGMLEGELLDVRVRWADMRVGRRVDRSRMAAFDAVAAIEPALDRAEVDVIRAGEKS